MLAMNSANHPMNATVEIPIAMRGVAGIQTERDQAA
jgi:hypothetical protein